MQDRWKMKRMYLEINGGSSSNSSNITMSNATLSRGDLDWTVPILYSWHCTNQTLYLDTLHYKNNSIYSGSFVTLIGYQVGDLLCAHLSMFAT